MLALLAAVLAALVAPPASAHPRRHHGLGAVTQLTPLPPKLRLAGAGQSWRVAYISTSWNGRPTEVTGTLTLPRGRAPRGGWPIVSFGHGMSGLADKCGPSRTGPSPWERAVQEALLAAGYAIAVTDYEGLGTPAQAVTGDGPSEAYSMIDIVRAARNAAPVSRRWAGVGYSLGGHASLWAASKAADYAPELSLQGTVAMAPVTQWALLYTAPVVAAPDAPLNPTLVYGAQVLSVMHPDRFDPKDVFTPAGMEMYRLASRVCIDDLAARVQGITNEEVLRDPSAASRLFAELMAEEEVPITDYGTPVRIAHGTKDVLPIVLSEITVRRLAEAGTDVSLTPVAGADHITLLPQIADDVRAWVDEYFAGT